MKYSCTGVILAGGMNKRFSGEKKAFIKVGGIRILDRIFGIFHELFKEVILVTNSPLQYLEWDVCIVRDLFPVRSSLTGIHAGLFFSNHSHAFFSASDTPFLKKELVETIVSSIGPKTEVIVPETSAGLEPLCAVYSKKRIHTIEKLLDRHNFKIQSVFKGVGIQKIPESRLRETDSDLLSFFNINTPEDLVRAKEIEAKTGRIRETHRSA